MDNNNNDLVAQRKQALIDALKNNQPVVVTPTGAPVLREEAVENNLSGVQIPEGKLAR